MTYTIDNTAWSWKMDWCLRKGLAPANPNVWYLATEAYNKRHSLTGVEPDTTVVQPVDSESGAG